MITPFFANENYQIRKVKRRKMDLYWWKYKCTYCLSTWKTTSKIAEHACGRNRARWSDYPIEDINK